MNRINQLFNSNKKDILSIYFCAGTPTLDGTADVIRTLEKHGVSMIEVGIPFSDPMADGIVIQNAATQALRNGMSLKLLFEQLRDIRKDVKIPLVLMGYLNPIMQFGFGDAIRYLKRGLKVARKGWNGKGMYLFLCFPASIEPKAENVEIYSARQSIAIRTADSSIVVGWNASQTDMLAEDWVFAE